MSLRWNVEKVKNCDEVCFVEAAADMPMRGVKKGERVLRVLTDALIWASLGVGLPRITEKNWRRWYARVHIIEKVTGAWRFDGDGTPVYFTPDEVRSHIGLSTNVTPETDAQWRKRHVTRWLEVAKARAERAETEAA